MNFLLDHIVLNCTDVEKMLEFYCTVFGFSAERLEMYREGKVSFPSVRVNLDTIIDLFPGRMVHAETQGEKSENNLNHFCFSESKEAVTRLAGRLENLGVVIEQGPVERWGAHGTGISIYFRDPELNLIEVRYYDYRADTEVCLLET
jgi:catechol 2,3-dioxygenase-like lactoylglutathione lyase family enzyme